jgi:hypothetical protein
VSCRHHLYLTTTSAGSISLRDPSTPVEEMAESCSLDIADRGSSSLETVGRAMNVTRQMVQMYEAEAVEAAGRALRRLRILP